MINRIRHFGANAIIVTVLCVMFVDAMPTTCRAHGWAKEAIDPALDKTGLWQGTWQLFAPEPDSVNTRFTAKLRFDDGSEFTWEAPVWKDTSSWHRFRNFRQIEYYDSLRFSDPAWDSFASYLALSAEAEMGGSKKVSQVELFRHSSVIPPPERTQRLLAVGGEWINAETECFYTWMAPQAVEE